MRANNLLIIMSDQHNRNTLGCYGHPLVRTPSLDRLAAAGTLFTDAYTPCPVCVPARAAFATGKYVHRIGTWDNAIPYDGRIPSWHHLLRERGHHVVSIGKLHFRSKDDDNGFSDEQIGMHIIDGQGDLLGLVRDEDMPKRGGSYKMARMAGPGESMYTTYDREIAARAQVWLREEARRHRDKPWVLFVSFVCPHFPLTAPPEHFYRYYDQELPPPKLYERRHEPLHPYLEDYRRTFAYDEFFETADMVKRAQAGYLGLCSFLDENVGKVLAALDQGGLKETTRVIYTSDHGDNLGARGLWGKSTMYEESVAVPLIASGPDIPAGKRVATPASLLDVYPFIIEAVGAASPQTITPDHPGVSIHRKHSGAATPPSSAPRPPNTGPSWTRSAHANSSSSVLPASRSMSDMASCPGAPRATDHSPFRLVAVAGDDVDELGRVGEQALPAVGLGLLARIALVEAPPAATMAPAASMRPVRPMRSAACLISGEVATMSDVAG